MTPAEVLRKAADLIEERGWWNGDGALAAARAGGPLCAGLAMSEADGTRDQWPSPGDERTASALASEAVRDRVGRGVVGWNDDQPNGGVVVAKLREVADDLEPPGDPG